MRSAPALTVAVILAVTTLFDVWEVAAKPSHCAKDCKQDIKNCLGLVPPNKNCTGTKAEKKACRKMYATQRKICRGLPKLCKQQNPNTSGVCLLSSTTTTTSTPTPTTSPFPTNTTTTTTLPCVDLTGNWGVNWTNNAFGSGTCSSFSIVQTGGNVSATGTCSRSVAPQGTLNCSTGHLTFTSDPNCTSLTFDATVTTNGTTFSGTYNCGGVGPGTILATKQ